MKDIRQLSKQQVSAGSKTVLYVDPFKLLKKQFTHPHVVKTHDFLSSEEGEEGEFLSWPFMMLLRSEIIIKR